MKSGNTGKSKNISKSGKSKNILKSGNTGKSGNIRISGNTGKSGNTYEISHLVDFWSCLHRKGWGTKMPLKKLQAIWISEIFPPKLNKTKSLLDAIIKSFCQALSISQSLNLSLSLRDRDRVDIIITFHSPHHTTRNFLSAL